VDCWVEESVCAENAATGHIGADFLVSLFLQANAEMNPEF
jgi:hypothetical protein